MPNQSKHLAAVPETGFGKRRPCNLVDPGCGGVSEITGGMRSQRTGEVRSKVQYFYFFSITVLQLLAIIALCNWKIFGGHPASKALYSSAIAIVTLAVLLWLRGNTIKRKKGFKNAFQKESGDLTKRIVEWKLKTDAEKDSSSR
jgi:hypothetical protein